MSLSKSLAGRKRDSALWDFFSYDAHDSKSSCLVVDEKTKVACGTQFKGKNTSNFAAHLKRYHKEAYARYDEKEKKKDAEKDQGVKRVHSGEVKSSKGAKAQTLGEFLERRIVSWPKDSVEHRRRVKSVINVVVSTGYPVRLVDQPSFRQMITVMDPKFKMPGQYSVFYCSV